MGDVGFSWGELRERDHSADIGVDGRRKLNGSSRSVMGRHEMD